MEQQQSIANGEEATIGGSKKMLGFAWNYVKNVASVFLEFTIPAAMFLAFNMAFTQNAMDPERIGLGWMHYSSQTNERAREEKFPAAHPDDPVHKRRLKHATANQAINDV